MKPFDCVLELWLPGPGDPSREALAGLSLELGRASTSQITFMDTFDGRLYQRGKVLLVECWADRRTDWVLRDVRPPGSELRIPVPNGPPPRFAWDVMDERLRGELEPLIDVRALLPIGQVQRSRQRVDGAIAGLFPVAELFLDRYRVSGSLSPPRARLIVEFTGESADKHARRAVERWAEESGLARPEQDLWLEWLALENKPSGPGFKPTPFDCAPDQRADSAVKQFLLGQLHIIRAQEQGIIDQVDAEFLHDFRVAIRRSRSIIGQLKGVFPPRAIAPFVRDLRWLGSVTGPSRDLDVYLLDFPLLEAALPEFMREDLAPLKTLLEAKSAANRRILVRSLKSRRYQVFTERWSRFLTKPVPSSPSAPRALQPIRTVAGSRIWTLYRRVSAKGRAIAPDTPAEAIHELRKSCKKIRYLMEFMQLIEHREAFRKPIRDLKQLQDHLGAFQDAEVQIMHIREWSAELAAKPSVPVPAVLALGALIGFFDQRQRDRRQRIPKALAEFGKKENRERIRHHAIDAEQPD